jgi:hypothetical protein
MALSIVMDLLMKTGSFETDTKRAEKRLQQFKKSADESAKAVAAAFAALGTAAAFWVRSTVQMGAEAQRFATLSNTTTENFQKLAAGAATVGIEQGKLADIFKDTQDKVGDFIQTGGGPLADFFENIAPRVGVTADQFRELSGPDALQLYVSSLQKANLSQADMIFYLEAIASDSSLLLPLLQDEGKAFKELGDQAQRFGAILDTDTIKQTEQLRSQMVQLDYVRQGFQNGVVKALLPTLINMSKRFLESAEDGRALDQAVRIAAAGVKILASVGAIVVGVFKTLGEALGGVGAAAVALFEGRFRDAFNIGKSAAVDFVGNLKGIAADLKGIWDDAAPPVIGSGGTPPPSGRPPLSKPPGAAKDTWEAEKRAALEAFKAYDEERAALMQRQAAQLAQSVELPYETLRRELQAVADLAPEVKKALGPETLGRLEDAAWQRYAQSIEYANEELDQFVMTMRENVQGLLGDSLYEAAKGNFDNILQSFADMLLRMVAQAQAANLTRALFGDQNGNGGYWSQAARAFGTWLSGGQSSDFVGPPESAAGSHAGGLNYVPHDGYMARLHKGERVLTADQNARTMPTAMGSAGSRVQVNNYMGNEAQARVSQRGDGTTVIDFERRMLSAVAADTARGGVTARATAGRMGLNNGSVLNRRRG